MTLQWGHDWVVVESGSRHKVAILEEGALQWGHDWVVVESALLLRQTSDTTWLQWGHDWVVVESRG